jgi:hypothetical protein
MGKELVGYGSRTGSDLLNFKHITVLYSCTVLSSEIDPAKTRLIR